MDKRFGDRQNGMASRSSPNSGLASPFVGREEELRRLGEALSLAADGRGGVVFLAGEPGIGKTRLAREALGVARGGGFTVLEGRAYSVEAGLAYSPFIDAFGPLLRRFDSAKLEAVVSGLPDLGRLFVNLGLPQPEPMNDPSVERMRLFETVSSLLERLSGEAPVVLFVDDLHRADSASLELFHYLGRGLAARRAFLLASIDSEASARHQGLRSLRRSLQGAGLAEEIVVSRLAPADAEALARGLLGGTAPAALLASLEARARGVPFFVEALVKPLVDSGCLLRHPSEKDGWGCDSERSLVLPQSIRDFVIERLERLAPPARRVLEVIAICGDATSNIVIQATSSLENEALHQILRGLRASQLVAEEPSESDVSYRITHPLIREVACAEIPEIERRRLRVVAAETLGRSRPADLTRGTRHDRDANAEADPTSKVEPAADGMDASMDVQVEPGWRYASESATTQGDLPTPIPGDYEEQSLPWLLERLGEIWERTGEGGAAVDVWNEALALLTEGGGRDGDALAVSRIHRRLALAEWDRGHFEIANAHLRSSSAALASRELSQELADLHYMRHHFHNRLEDAADAAETVAKLLSVAKQLDSPRAEAEASLVAFVLSMEQGKVAGARELALRALTLAESFPEGQDLANCCRAHNALAGVGMRLGDHHFMRYHAERGLSRAQRLGTPYREALLSCRLAYASFLSGAWEESLRWDVEAIALARRAGYPRYLAYALLGRAMTLAFRGELPEAEACIAEVRMVFGSGTLADRAVLGLIDVAETALALERGQVERALGIARGFIRPPKQWEVIPTVVTAESKPLALMLLAEAQVGAGNPEGALETARKLAALGPTGAPYLVALASRAEGLARQALGQREAAMVCLARAYETFTAIEIPFEAARSALEQAMVAALIQPSVAATAAQRSLTILESLGAQRYADRARRLLRGLGISPPSIRRIRITGSPLSARELQVARMVAEGFGTVEIAERLSVSPRTVTTHLDHIYARLGLSSRIALVRYVTESGLLSAKGEDT